MSNLIKYNKESYLFAKLQIIPNAETIESVYGAISVPEVCRIAGDLLLSELDEYENKMSFVRKCSFIVLSTFSKQLHVNGSYEFGNHDIFKIISSKDL